ncbi:MAG TPA: DUF3737 family protein [Candidatus Monoglobus merdigallinarum]|uniref:DUF3737 family protein n=1 Tax=Candidatus Monoglobus merdigallinarum TaxID=2838698 RepID=A0A9D1PRH6_9FIRM|nr:DUF3737 family protein [Candidatus Monoglobus merdigallinarum]
MRQIRNMTFDDERALFGIHDAEISGCEFSGISGGESALKECGGIKVSGCTFKLKYPLWNTENGEITGSRLNETCRAALWYDNNIRINNCVLNGIKALRECESVSITDCRIRSLEFGWKCRGIRLDSCSVVSEYPFFMSRDIDIDKLELAGKYAFQYVENTAVNSSEINSNDAFWHAKNVTVCDSVIRSDCFAWYSENLRLVRCRIIGTQPLCYAKGLILEECDMSECDLAFEYSDVRADMTGRIQSVKNPLSGYIRADSIGEVIVDNNRRANSDCEIICRK